MHSLTMRDRGKAVATAYNTSSRRSTSSNNKYDSASSSSSRMRMSSSDVAVVHCRKHPSSSGSAGICAYCLKERLMKLVCSDCGEQRLSSCSCSSDLSSNRNSSASSCAIIDVGSVGRVSFLIQNQRISPNPTQTQPKSPSSSSVDLLEDDPIFLRESSSSSRCSIRVKPRRSTGGGGGGFRGIRKFFEKKKSNKKDNRDGFDDDGGDGGGGKNETWVVGNRTIPRSRSLCSFRGDESGGRGDLNLNLNLDGARSSSGKSGDLVKPEGGFDHVKGANRRVFSLRESDNITSDSGFIDLKLGFPAAKDLASARSYSSCGFADRGTAMSKSRKSTNVWRWIFRGRKRDEEHTIEK